MGEFRMSLASTQENILEGLLMLLPNKFIDK
jgi:hypothetical protein